MTLLVVDWHQGVSRRHALLFGGMIVKTNEFSNFWQQSRFFYYEFIQSSSHISLYHCTAVKSSCQAAIDLV